MFRRDSIPYGDPGFGGWSYQFGLKGDKSTTRLENLFRTNSSVLSPQRGPFSRRRKIGGVVVPVLASEYMAV